MSALMATYANTSAFTSRSVGFSPESKTPNDMMGKVLIEFKKTVTFGYKNKIIQNLKEVLEECSEENWDGYGAAPISEESYSEVLRLIDCLPLMTSGTIIPEVVPEPNGELALEWYKGKRSVFVASVRGKNEIVYAGLFGTSKKHGTEYFGDSLPSEILNNIKRLVTIQRM